MLVPFKQHTNRNAKEELNILLQKGFARLYVNGETVRIEDLLSEGAVPSEKTTKTAQLRLPKGNTYLLIDRIVVKEFDEDDIIASPIPSELLFMKVKGRCCWRLTVKSNCISQSV